MEAENVRDFDAVIATFANPRLASERVYFDPATILRALTA